MIKTILLIITITLMVGTNNSYSAEINTLPRLGDTVDSYERQYFGLFKNAKSFERAILNHSNGNYSFSIETSEEKPYTIEIENVTFRQLCFFVEHFESLQYKYHDKIPINAKLWETVNPYFKYRKCISHWLDKNDISFTGQLLFADSSYVAFYSSDECYDYTKLKDFLVLLPISIIRELNDILVECSRDYYYLNMDYLNEFSVFVQSDSTHAIPKDLLDYINENELELLITSKMDDGRRDAIIAEEKKNTPAVLDIDRNNLTGGVLFGNLERKNLQDIRLTTFHKFVTIIEDFKFNHEQFITSFFIESDILLDNFFIYAANTVCFSPDRKKTDFSITYDAIEFGLKYRINGY